MSRKAHILIVDDDPDVRASIVAVLGDEGYATEIAADGRSAAERLFRGAELPSLIIVDLMMPIMNGWELIDLLKNYARTSKIPVIVVSAACESPPPGVSFLRKPLHIEDLLRVVREKSNRTAVP